ncbi:hypothetical protein M9H77_08367 [Catharanthus roseus]|uniref:Uncharacterized protein n=1 Tax=Catharanthus roseus TaxID=4058 RepID=A0ACC0BXR7_CATRO|nr:hypothetical protein M9H77_08367 [Catharanthus roseus]
MIFIEIRIRCPTRKPLTPVPFPFTPCYLRFGCHLDDLLKKNKRYPLSKVRVCSKRSRAKREGRRRSSEARGKERRTPTSNESSVQPELEELKAKQRLFTSSTMSK